MEAFPDCTDYDADFTAEISNKMRVPERLSFVTSENSYNSKNIIFETTNKMKVPEHITFYQQKNLPSHDLNLEDPFTSKPDYDIPTLQTPPRNLVLGDIRFPTSLTYDELNNVESITKASIITENLENIANRRSFSDNVTSQSNNNAFCPYKPLSIEDRIDYLEKRLAKMEKILQEKNQREMYTIYGATVIIVLVLIHKLF